MSDGNDCSPLHQLFQGLLNLANVQRDGNNWGKNGKCNHIPLVGGESFFFEATSEENLGFC